MTTPLLLPAPPHASRQAEEWVAAHLGDVVEGPVAASLTFSGGQAAADAALAGLDITGYGRTRSNVMPPVSRGASRLSPYIRHGLLPLPTVWNAVEDAPSWDRFRFQGELLWQEYARHWYAMLGTATRRPVSHQPVNAVTPWPHPPWWQEMRCMEATLDELHRDGWCVNQTRMWLASQFTVRGQGAWREGEDHMFRHLLDGSRAANRLGWQWTVGASRPRAYGFARRQVLRRAKEFCVECRLRDDCPIRSYAEVAPRSTVPPPPLLAPDVAFGPATAPTDAHPEVVWLTGESLGRDDPAMRAHPSVPAVFVFDIPMLAALRLSGKRLVFLAQALAEHAHERPVEVWRGSPAEVLRGRRAAVTFAPVPGFRRLARGLTCDVYPWPWLRPPTAALVEHCARRGRFPGFRDWCRLTREDADDA